MSLSRMLVFAAVALTIPMGVHAYFWLRLVRDTGLPLPYRSWVGWVLLALFASLPIALFVGRKLPPVASAFLAWPAFIWLGLMFLLFVALLLGDALRVVAYLVSAIVAGGRPALDPERRLFLARAVGLGATGLTGVIGSWALYGALARVRVKQIDVRLARLHPDHHGMIVAQLTDVHVGPTIGRRFIADIVRRTNELRPDLIAITGDLVDGTVASLREAVAPLADLRARHGVFFVTGNHEYFSGVDEWVVELRRLGIRVLRNERAVIGQGESAFDLVGVDDFSARRFAPGRGPDLPRAVAGRDPQRELVLLAHQPAAVTEAADHGVGLQLSGHTHGGQLWPFTYLVGLAQPYVQGLHRHRDTQIYVSPGTGYWGPPLRLGTRPEITRLTLLSERVNNGA